MFTKKELQLIIGLCDLAVKSAGLQTSQNVYELARKTSDLLSKESDVAEKKE